MLLGVGDLCRMLYCLYLKFQLKHILLYFKTKEFPLPLGAKERLRYFIVALPAEITNKN